MKFRKIAVEIEAEQFTALNPYTAMEFCPTGILEKNSLGEMQMIVPTLEGAMIASDGDFIIKGVAGEFYPCKPDIFFRTNEPA